MKSHLGSLVSTGPVALSLMMAVTPASANTAGPTELTGVYGFSGEIRPVKTVRKERVYTPAAEGRARLAELVSQGFSCMRSTPQFHVCKMEFPGQPFPAEISNRIARAEEKTGDVAFEVLRDAPELTFEGEVAQEWSVPQYIAIGQKSFDSHRRLLSRGVEKIKAGAIENGIGFEFVYDPKDDALLSMVAVASTKGFVTDEYIGFSVRKLK